LFDGVRRAYDLVVLFLMEVIGEIGTDPALGLINRAVERQADIIAGELKRVIPKGLKVQDLGLEVYRKFMEDVGSEIKVISKNVDSVNVAVGRCPFFEAFLDVEVECGYFVSGLCTNLVLPSVQAVLKRFNSKFRLEATTIRQTAEERCFVSINLEE
jgi:hypothetical protein